MAAALLGLTDCCQPCCTTQTIIITEPGEGDDVTGWFKRKSIVEGKAVPSLSTNIKLEINGFEVGGDGFVGHFTWDALSSAAGDDAFVLMPNDSPTTGRWIRMT